MYLQENPRINATRQLRENESFPIIVQLTTRASGAQKQAAHSSGPSRREIKGMCTRLRVNKVEGSTKSCAKALLIGITR